MPATRIPFDSESNGLDAAPDDAAPSPGDHLVFEAGRLACAACATEISEVISLGRITPLPGTAPAVLGLFHHRGELIVAIDAGRLLEPGPPDSPERRRASAGPSSRLLLIRQGKHVIGLMVDSVAGILHLGDAPASPEPPPAPSAGLCDGAVTHEGRTVLRLVVPSVLARIDTILGQRP
ncbi:MAG: chemotaxis protein CheW [Candidatus Wallbacteria bacterium]|nr:chemotaxis protein CheW [Candidatus Wallbacteria bacterium]